MPMKVTQSDLQDPRRGPRMHCSAPRRGGCALHVACTCTCMSACRPAVTLPCMALPTAARMTPTPADQMPPPPKARALRGPATPAATAQPLLEASAGSWPEHRTGAKMVQSHGTVPQSHDVEGPGGQQPGCLRRKPGLCLLPPPPSLLSPSSSAAAALTVPIHVDHTHHRHPPPPSPSSSFILYAERGGCFHIPSSRRMAPSSLCIHPLALGRIALALCAPLHDPSPPPPPPPLHGRLTASVASRGARLIMRMSPFCHQQGEVQPRSR